jgi:cytochrome c-type biogenesis protein CcmH
VNGWLFWIAAAAMTACVVALLLRDLLTLDTGPVSSDGFDSTVYRDQLKELERERAAGEIGAVEAEAARAEIARRLLAASGATKPAVAVPSRPPQMVAMGLAVLLPIAALAIYLGEGTPSLPSQPFAARATAGLAAGPAAAIVGLPPDEQTKAIRSMVDGLAARLQQSPDDLQGWVRLARARGVLGDTAAAVDAYARAVALAPDNIDLLRVYADALLAARRSEEMPPVLEAGLPRMLAADPKDLVALWFRGVATQKAGQPEEARQAWSEMSDQFPEGSPERAAIKQRISQLPVPERPHGHTLPP